ncbi:MAG: DoxX family protein [Pirellulales bacterium]
MATKIAYWITTILVAAAYGLGGYFDVAQPPDMMKQGEHLGYPAYFFTILGVWKLGAVIALLAPGLPRLKEWTYAGIFFNLTGAAATHAVVKDPLANVAVPLVLLAIALTSWALRLESRRLSGPWV